MKVFVCRAVLFDMDGVLVDSTPCIERHWSDWAKLHGKDLAEITKVAHGRKTIETLKIIAPELDIAAEAAALSLLGETDLNGVSVIPGANDLLASLPEDQWAIVTSSPRAVALARLTHCRLPIPKTLITADDIQRGKPAPDCFLTGASALHCPPENCVVIEDAPSGIDAAIAAGMQVIAVVSTHTQAQLQAANAVVNCIPDIQARQCDGEIELRAIDN